MHFQTWAIQITSSQNFVEKHPHYIPQTYEFYWKGAAIVRIEKKEKNGRCVYITMFYEECLNLKSNFKSSNRHSNQPVKWKTIQITFTLTYCYIETGTGMKANEIDLTVEHSHTMNSNKKEIQTHTSWETKKWKDTI